MGSMDGYCLPTARYPPTYGCGIYWITDGTLQLLLSPEDSVVLDVMLTDISSQLRSAVPFTS